MIVNPKAAALFLLLVPVQGAKKFGPLPPGGPEEDGWAEVLEAAFPTWCTDEDENRIEGCGGRWDPFYLTKEHGGEDPALGGYPTDIDTRYPFYYGSAFFGQACAGGNAHCSFDFDASKIACNKCGKIQTLSDDGPNGPGHVPPHIGLAALTRSYNAGLFGDPADWFNYDQNACRIMPHVLLTMIRHYFPRNPDGTASYPPPFTKEGGTGGPNGEADYPYPLEYVNLVGERCSKEQEKWPSAQCYEAHSGGNIFDYPTYLDPGHGSPHYCTPEAMDAQINKDWCPYIFFGPKRGKYRHPHIAFAAVETWLSNKVMPDKCGSTWDENDGETYPYTPDNSVAFPMMSNVERSSTGGRGDPQQPTIDVCGMWVWPNPRVGVKRKAVEGSFITNKYIAPSTLEPPLDPSFYECQGNANESDSSESDSSESDSSESDSSESDSSESDSDESDSDESDSNDSYYYYGKKKSKKHKSSYFN